MVRWSLLSIPLLVLCTACPEVWGRDGTIEKAMAKDVRDEVMKRRRPPNCHMSDEEWVELCDDGNGQNASDECPDDCRD